jgi:NtrC-family two-component system response regulator AlgB
MAYASIDIAVEAVNRIEEEHIQRVLADTRSRQEASDILGIDQATLWRRHKQYGI